MWRGWGSVDKGREEGECACACVCVWVCCVVGKVGE